MEVKTYTLYLWSPCRQASDLPVLPGPSRMLWLAIVTKSCSYPYQSTFSRPRARSGLWWSSNDVELESRRRGQPTKRPEQCRTDGKVTRRLHRKCWCSGERNWRSTGRRRAARWSYQCIASPHHMHQESFLAVFQSIASVVVYDRGETKDW